MQKMTSFYDFLTAITNINLTNEMYQARVICAKFLHTLSKQYKMPNTDKADTKVAFQISLQW